MAVEIERKWVLSPKADVVIERYRRSKSLQRTLYIDEGEHYFIRARIESKPPDIKSCKVTIKPKETALARTEWESSISVEEWEALSLKHPDAPRTHAVVWNWGCILKWTLKWYEKPRQVGSFILEAEGPEDAVKAVAQGPLVKEVTGMQEYSDYGIAKAGRF